MKNPLKNNANLEGNGDSIQVVSRSPEFIVSDGFTDSSDIASDRICADGHTPNLNRSVSMFTRKLQNTSQDIKRMVGMAVDFFAVVVALAIAFLLRLTVIDVSQLLSLIHI